MPESKPPNVLALYSMCGRSRCPELKRASSGGAHNATCIAHQHTQHKPDRSTGQNPLGVPVSPSALHCCANSGSSKMAQRSANGNARTAKELQRSDGGWAQANIRARQMGQVLLRLFLPQARTLWQSAAVPVDVQTARGTQNKSSPRLDAFRAERTMRAREHCRRLRLAHADHTIQPGDRTDRRPANANANARRVIDRRKVTAGTV